MGQKYIKINLLMTEISVVLKKHFCFSLYTSITTSTIANVLIKPQVSYGEQYKIYTSVTQGVTVSYSLRDQRKVAKKNRRSH